MDGSSSPTSASKPAPSAGNANASSSSDKVVVKAVDMADSLKDAAVEIALQASENHTVEKDIAMYIKKEMDRQYGPTWHVVVGRSFGSYVTHESGNFLYFYMGTTAVLLFKSG